jgi:uncharacterized damage-inducible protein DinB
MTMARGWLTHRRESAVFKLEDLDDEQLRWMPTATANSLGQIVVHLGYAERLWLRAIFAGETMDMSWRAHMFVLPSGWSVDDVITFYQGETRAADAVLDRVDLLDRPSAAEFRPTTLRWVLTHLLEEIARHAGHMDSTRELLDARPAADPPPTGRCSTHEDSWVGLGRADQSSGGASSETALHAGHTLVSFDRQITTSPKAKLPMPHPRSGGRWCGAVSGFRRGQVPGRSIRCGLR